MNQNWEVLNPLLNSMKYKQERDSEELLRFLSISIQTVDHMYSRGYPETEIGAMESGQLYGIPIELANIVRYLFQFAADNNIDLVDALSRGNLSLAS